MPFVTSNALSNLTVDGAYVFLQAPQGFAGVGVPTSLGAIVGSGSWGPLNVALPFSDSGSLYAQFGSLAGNITAGTSDPYSLVMEGYCAVSLSNNFLGVRVDDGTSAKATNTFTDSVTATGCTATALFTGQDGNNITMSLSSGSVTGTVTAAVQRSGYAGEVYGNIAIGSSGAFWTNLKNALANGITSQRGPSQLATIALATSTHAPVVPQTITLSGGTNGATSVTTAIQLGTDNVSGTSRTGMYALRGLGASQFILAGNSDSSAWGAQATFGTSEGMIPLCVFPTGTSTSAAITSKQSVGLSTVDAEIQKDWVYVYDPSQSAKRLISPLGLALGHVSSLAPEQSPGNKPVNGMQLVLSTERTGQPYSLAEMSLLQQNGINVITNPIPRGNVYGFASGLNSAATPGSAGVEYTRMDNFLGASIQQILGTYVDELQGTAANDPTRLSAKASLSGFLQTMLDQNRIAGFNIQLDLSNNTQTTIAQGFCLATVAVQFMGTIRFFLATIIGGAAVVTSSSTPNVA